MPSIKTTQDIRPHDPHAAAYRRLGRLAGLIGIALLAFFSVTVPASPLVISEQAVSELIEGDLVFIDRTGRYFVDYDRGDLIAYSDAAGELKTAESIGRLIAFSGERVDIAKGRIYIDGMLLDESEYAQLFPDSLRLSFTVREGELLLLPDAREGLLSFSGDDYSIPLDCIAGEIRFRAYPLDRLAFFK